VLYLVNIQSNRPTIKDETCMLTAALNNSTANQYIVTKLSTIKSNVMKYRCNLHCKH